MRRGDCCVTTIPDLPAIISHSVEIGFACYVFPAVFLSAISNVPVVGVIISASVSVVALFRVLASDGTVVCVAHSSVARLFANRCGENGHGICLLLRWRYPVAFGRSELQSMLIAPVECFEASIVVVSLRF